MVASSAAMPLRLAPPIEPKWPPAYTVEPDNVSALTGALASGFQRGRATGRGVQRGDPVARGAADQTEVAAGVDGRA